jgi:glycerate dehydrogenase
MRGVAEEDDLKIVVLDGYAMNPGDLDWGVLSRLAGADGFTVHDRTPKELVRERIGDAEAVFTNKTLLRRETLASAPRLKYIGVLATGYNVVDLTAANERGIVVTHVPGYSTDAVAQFVFALLLEVASRVGDHDACVHRGEWEACEDFSFFRRPLMELSGKTLGIVGYGAIGQAVARIAKAIGMQVLACRTSPFPSDGVVEPATFDEVLARSDVVTLHCPLTEATRGLMDRAAFDRMKDGAVLVNAARGPIVVEEHLAEALRSGKLSAAAVDVLSQEPAQPGNPLLSAPNCIITPHIAWAARETRMRLLERAAENLAAFQAGRPLNVVRT